LYNFPQTAEVGVAGRKKVSKGTWSLMGESRKASGLTLTRKTYSTRPTKKRKSSWADV